MEVCEICKCIIKKGDGRYRDNDITLCLVCAGEAPEFKLYELREEKCLNSEASAAV